MSENESPDAEASQHRRPDDWALDRGRDHALTGEEIELPGAEFGDAADIVGLSSVPVVTGEIEAVSIGARRSSNPNVGPLQPKIEDRIATGEIPVAPVPSASAIPVVPAPGAGAEAEPDAGPRDSGASGRDPSGAPGPEAGAASTTAREQEGAPEPAVEGAGAKGRAGDSSGPGKSAPSPEPAKETGSAHSSEPGAPTAPPDSGDEGPAPAPAPGAPPDSAPAPEAEPLPSPEPEPEPDAGAPGAADTAFPPPAPADTRSTQDTIISDRPLVPRSSAQPGKGRGARKGAGAAQAPGAVKGAGAAEPEDAPPAPDSSADVEPSQPPRTATEPPVPPAEPDSSEPPAAPPAAPGAAKGAGAAEPEDAPPAPDSSADVEPSQPPRTATEPPVPPAEPDSTGPATEPSAASRGADDAPAPAAQPPSAPGGADEAPSPHGRARHGIPLPEEPAGAARPKRRSWPFSSRAAQKPPASPEPERAGERAQEPPAPPLPEEPEPAEEPEEEHKEGPPSAAEEPPSATPSPWSVLPPGAPWRSRRRGAGEARAKRDDESPAATAPDADAEAESPRAPGGAGRPKPPATRMSRRARLGWDRPAPAAQPAAEPADEEPATSAEEPAYPTAAFSDGIRYPTAFSAGTAYPSARADEDSARADDETGAAEDTTFDDGADYGSAYSPWPSSTLPMAGSTDAQSSSWNDEMTRTYWHSPEDLEPEPVRAHPDIDETGVIAPTRRSLLSSVEEAEDAARSAPEEAEEEAEEPEESVRPASLDDAIFEGTTVKAELPNRSRAHWMGLVAFAIGVPLAWFLAADAGARMTLADNAPMVTGTASFLALGELLGALAFSVLLIASARQSSLGAWAVGGLFTVIGLPWVLVPGPTATAMFPVMSALQSSGAVGANLQHHLQASGYSGRLLLIGVVLIGLGYVSHTTRRIGRAEEARRAEVERVNPSGAHFTSRERRRAHRAEGKR